MSEWTLQRMPNGRLLLRQGGVENYVTAVTCFPWTHPHELIALIDDAGHERLFLEALTAATPSAQLLLLQELRQRNFLPQITAVHSIVEDVELFAWKVTTDAGMRAFLTKRNETFRQLPGGGVLIRDVGNDLLLISKPRELDKKSLALLWAYLD